MTKSFPDENLPRRKVFPDEKVSPTNNNLRGKKLEKTECVPVVSEAQKGTNFHLNSIYKKEKQVKPKNEWSN